MISDASPGRALQATVNNLVRALVMSDGRIELPVDEVKRCARMLLHLTGSADRARAEHAVASELIERTRLCLRGSDNSTVATRLRVLEERLASAFPNLH